MTITTTETIETKVCQGCEMPQPITEFRLRRRGGQDRMNLCRQCHNDKERERRHAKERVLRHRVGKEFIRKLLRREGNPDDLVAAAVRELGSAKLLAQAVADYLQVAPQRVKWRYSMWMLDWLQKREKRR